MGIIIKTLKVSGDKDIKEEKVLFDSGAACSVIKRSVAQKIATIVKIPIETKFKLGDGKTILTTNKVANIVIQIDGKKITDQFHVLEKLGKEIILGANTMQKWDIVLEPKEDKIIVRRDPMAIEFF